jgi:hypothetical protein
LPDLPSGDVWRGPAVAVDVSVRAAMGMAETQTLPDLGRLRLAQARIHAQHFARLASIERHLRA